MGKPKIGECAPKLNTIERVTSSIQSALRLMMTSPGKCG
jgi:hypothetical protein